MVQKILLKTLGINEYNPAQSVKNVSLIALGVLLAGIGLKGFLLPNSFLDGGVMGMSLLINITTDIPLPYLIIIVNLPFIFLAYSQVSKFFAIKTLMGIVGLAVCIAFIEIPLVTSDKLLIAIFGGFFLGAGIGMSIRGGGVLDGTEVLALYISRKTVLSVGDVIIIINVLIFSVAAFLINIETALYAMLTYLSASKTIDFLIHGIEEYTGVTIISEKSEEIRVMIIEQLGRGVTIFKAKRGFGKRGRKDEDLDVVYTVLTRLEIQKLTNEIENIDPTAFVVQQSLNDVKGGMIKKLPLH
ncbi:YitT family protein [Flectobacillus longus]|uniref:YitT family protein n=1 Tax=Flectobacillus longus TaxID=2984207 RepID=A0ABT6YP50_9BACT|nr:YitT family protein [Flectobacillus longus]MDI9865367.1 YitT family protein [Flectobacillus longus]MDI9881760.1 YitT family protein [Flectobacillus longus]